MSDMPPPPPSSPFSPQPAPQPADHPGVPRPPAPAPSPYTVPGPAPAPGPGPWPSGGTPPPGFGGPGFGGPGFGGPGYGGPGAGPAFGGGGFPAAPSRSGKAIAALVLGIAGALLCFIVVPSILAIVFGILALKEVKRGAGTVSGKGMAIAGLVLGIVGVVVAVIFWVAVGFGLANSKDVFDLERGDCINLPDDDPDQLGRVQVVECTDPHDAEVFATGELDGGDEPYPGVDEVTALIQEECTPEFEDYVGIDFESSELEATTIYPQEADWDTTQQYVCIAYLDGEELTESVADSDR